MTAPTYVIVPGLRGHVEEHWQTLLAGELPDALIVPPLEENPIDLTARLSALESTVAAATGPVILVAHSAGVPTVVYWAQQTTQSVAGALLATPPDLRRPMAAPHPSPEQLADGGWGEVPMTPLPWPSIVVASTDDPLASVEAVTGFAEAWGSRLVDAGAVGHLNPTAGYGPWPQATELLAELREVAGLSAAV
ncbi:RBBP9/YdeN family alpha/beta hydrolase [Gordonia hydrophobica]|uniref:Alpha/beta hydrolase n=1 Tax=Gordonia hydrophobica TaxID=40516 RepID=A0ABZ2TZF1_9ACTN|nr:alpha/beta hydrolase [Gordonia hydrophobica]MBM7368955.1 putative alpha/beta hydrolase family esterase [Gordonia hydrophobica]